MTTKLSRVISKENGKKWMVAVNLLEDFVAAGKCFLLMMFNFEINKLSIFQLLQNLTAQSRKC